MRKKETEFLTEEEAEAILRVSDRRTIQGKRDYAIILTLLAIQDYLKVNGNGIDPDHPIFKTLGKHGPYEERCLTPKAVDCLVRSASQGLSLQLKQIFRVRNHMLEHSMLIRKDLLKIFTAGWAPRFFLNPRGGR